MYKNVSYLFLSITILAFLKTYGADFTESIYKSKSPCCCSFVCRFTTKRATETELLTQPPIIRRASDKMSEMPSLTVLKVVSFLDYLDELKVSHLSKKLKLTINEEFWENSIQQNQYIIWDNTVPKVKVFFANYLYHKGFGRHPKLPEKIEVETETVTPIPNILLAERALKLAFPKGRENLRQAQHKVRMDSALRSFELQISSSLYYVSCSTPSIYETLFRK
jgi:hypothetical protein